MPTVPELLLSRPRLDAGRQCLGTIADLLGLDIGAVERHIKSIYRKLHDDQPESRDEPEDRRVRAALLYLKATGLLSPEPIPQY